MPTCLSCAVKIIAASSRTRCYPTGSVLNLRRPRNWCRAKISSSRKYATALFKHFRPAKLKMRVIRDFSKAI